MYVLLLGTTYRTRYYTIFGLPNSILMKYREKVLVRKTFHPQKGWTQEEDPLNRGMQHALKNKCCVRYETYFSTSKSQLHVLCPPFPRIKGTFHLYESNKYSCIIPSLSWVDFPSFSIVIFTAAYFVQFSSQFKFISIFSWFILPIRP